MGIIQKQSIRSTLFITIGFAIGAFNMLVLFPKFFSQAEIGLTRALIDTSLTLSTLCTLGSLPVIYKFYPFYNDYLGPKKNDLPMITALLNLAGFMLVLLLGYLFKDFIIKKLGKSPLYAQYFSLTYPFTLLMLLFVWLEAFAWAAKKTVFTNFLKETALRIITTIAIVLYGVGWISFQTFIVLFSLTYLLPVLALLWILLRSHQWQLKWQPISRVTQRLKKRMISFALFVFGAQFLNVLVRTNDTFLIFGLKGLNETGIFAIATYVIAVLEIPQRSINSISIPILAESWKNKNLGNIRNIYHKSVSNLLAIALCLFGLIWLNIHNLSFFLNGLTKHKQTDYSLIESVVLIMGIAKVIDLGTGINAQIIGTSNYWKFDFATNICYLIFSIPLNFVLIKHFGLPGLALSNLMALFLYNSVRYWFLWKKFNLQPYTFRHLFVTLTSAMIYLLVFHIPAMGNLYTDTLYRSLIFLALFLPTVYYSKIAQWLQVSALLF